MYAIYLSVIHEKAETVVQGQELRGALPSEIDLVFQLHEESLKTTGSFTHQKV